MKIITLFWAFIYIEVVFFLKLYQNSNRVKSCKDKSNTVNKTFLNVVYQRLIKLTKFYKKHFK